jgi:hypothetical protein
MPQVKSPSPNRKLFLTILCCLAAAPNAKLGDAQALEIFLLLHFSFLVAQFAYAGLRCRVYEPWPRLGIPFGIFLMASLLLALASMRFRFYPPPGITFLRMPLILSIARVVELALGIFYMLYLASILRREPVNRRYAMRAYFWAGVASAAFSLLSYPLLFMANLEWGVYLPGYRARGWFNEGGPYGLYLASVIIVGLLLYDLHYLKRIQVWGSGIILLLALVGSQSKATFMAACVLILLNLVLVGTFRQRIALAAFALALCTVVWTMTPVPQLMIGYVNAYEIVQQYGNYVDEDAYGGFGGRVAGMVLVPRMVLAHPITGIGLGNFSLLRNSPEYLQGLPTRDNWELPGIGLIAYVAELGIPLFTYLMLLLCLPAWMTRHRISMFAFILAAYQPVAHIFGVQLNFYYPWICSAFALSIPESEPSRIRERADPSAKMRLEV